MKTNLSIHLFIAVIITAGTACPAMSHAGESRIRILQNMTYHKEEVADVKNGERWIAIVESQGKYSARAVTVSVKTVKDDIVDADAGPFTGKEISSVPTAAFLIKGLPLKNGTPIPSYFTGTVPIDEGKPVEIKGAHSTLILKGKTNIHLKTDDYETKDAYQLIGEMDGKTFTLIEPMPTDDNVPHLIWAGDLNQDGQPDLFIDITNHYNVYHPALFLSKTGKNGTVYRKVAARYSVGC